MALRGGHGPYSIINYSWHLRLPTLRDNARLHSSTVALVFPWVRSGDGCGGEGRMKGTMLSTSSQETIW